MHTKEMICDAISGLLRRAKEGDLLYEVLQTVSRCIKHVGVASDLQIDMSKSPSMSRAVGKYLNKVLPSYLGAQALARAEP
jgi:hypothetical protein